MYGDPFFIYQYYRSDLYNYTYDHYGLSANSYLSMSISPDGNYTYKYSIFITGYECSTLLEGGTITTNLSYLGQNLPLILEPIPSISATKVDVAGSVGKGIPDFMMGNLPPIVQVAQASVSAFNGDFFPAANILAPPI